MSGLVEDWPTSTCLSLKSYSCGFVYTIMFVFYDDDFWLFNEEQFFLEKKQLLYIDFFQ